MIAEYNGATLLARFIHGPGTDDPVAVVDIAGARHFYHADATGTIVALSGETGLVEERYATGAFGAVDATSGLANYRFAGRPYDLETGLYYNRARYYHPGLGRFLSPDPSGYADGLNMYAYAANDPVNLADPSGLNAKSARGVRGDESKLLFAVLSVKGGGGRIGALAAAAGTLLKVVYGVVRKNINKAGKEQLRKAANRRLMRSGQKQDKNGLTKAGRALQKHGDRSGSVFPRSTGNATARNSQGQKVLESILKSKNKLLKPNRFGGKDIFDKNTDRGVRFDKGGNFKGFLEP